MPFHMNRSILIPSLLLLSALLLSCSDSRLERALEQSGNNRAELERVLAHFEESGDTLKLNAAKFLIRNMPYNHFPAGREADLYDSAYIAMSEVALQDREKTFKEHAGKIPVGNMTAAADITNLTADFLINAIDEACNVWRESSWNTEYDTAFFYEYVLPYRILNESPSDWWSFIRQEYPFLNRKTVLSKRGEQMEAEHAESNAEKISAEGASKGKMLMFDSTGENAVFCLNTVYGSDRQMYLRYTTTTRNARLGLRINGGSCDTILLTPTNALYAFATSKNSYGVNLHAGDNIVTLEFVGDTIGIDYIQLNTVETYNDSIAEDFSEYYCRITNKMSGNCITIDSLQDSLPCAGVARPVLRGDRNQMLRLDYKGYACWSIMANDTATDLCLETEYCSVEHNSPVGLYKYLNGSNQKWVFLPTDGGFYRIMNKDSGMFLEAKSIGETDTLAQNPYKGIDAQLWKIEKTGQHAYSDRTFRKGSAISEALRIFDITGQYEWAGYNGGIAPKGESLLRGKTGNCRDEANYTVYLCRSMGIPSAVDFTPHWGNRSLSHSWSVLIKPDGKGTPFYMGCAPCDTAHYYHPYKKPKVFRYRFQPNRQYMDDLKWEAEVPSLFRTPRFTDATDEYYETTDVVRDIPENAKEERVAYICVFDNRNWVPVHYGVVKKGKVAFKSMGRNIMYMAAFYKNGMVMPFGNPFCIEGDGTVRDIARNDSATQSMKLLRKYPFMGKEDFFNLRMSGGKFQGSNTSDFSKCDNLYIFEGATNGNWYDVEVDNATAFRYLRYIGPATSHCNINEMEFYDTDGNRIKGETIGTEGEPWALKEAVFDGNILTGFNSISPDGNWVGLKLSSPRKVGRIRFIGRNDGNGIEIGDEYMLMCWCDGWKTLGVIKAENNHVIFNNVPSGGLYVLRNLTKGHEERIFTYENQEQVWW